MGRPKKYLTEEERKAARKEYLKQYYRQYRQDNNKYYKEYQKQYQKQYREDNKEYFKQYYKEYFKQYYQDNKEYYKQYYQDNKEYFKEHQKQYLDTPMGRAILLVNNYKREDEKYNRGECTLTPEWIVENIFSKPCHYCGESDWTKIGCDRIDNSKPHTPDNVVPCCGECNKKRGSMPYEEFMKRISNK